MINKTVLTLDDAVANLTDGITILVGGFGEAGMPNELLAGVLETGITNLTLVSNNAGVGETGMAALMRAGRVRRIICSFPRSAGSVVFEECYAAGQLELEVVPQGTLSERIRAGGAGIGAFYLRTGVGTLLTEGKETRVIDGHTHVLEYPIHGDVALIKADTADRWQPHLPRRRPQFRPGDGTGRRTHHRPGPPGGPARRHQPRTRCHPRHLR